MKDKGMYVRKSASKGYEVVENETDLIIRTLDTSQEANQFIELVKTGGKKQ